MRAPPPEAPSAPEDDEHAHDLAHQGGCSPMSEDRRISNFDVSVRHRAMPINRYTHSVPFFVFPVLHSPASVLLAALVPQFTGHHLDTETGRSSESQTQAITHTPAPSTSGALTAGRTLSSICTPTKACTLALLPALYMHTVRVRICSARKCSICSASTRRFIVVYPRIGIGPASEPDVVVAEVPVRLLRLSCRTCADSGRFAVCSLCAPGARVSRSSPPAHKAREPFLPCVSRRAPSLRRG